MVRKIELLCPAKNLETGIAAINFGADAVYIGPENFGARYAAGNSLEDIELLINYAHKFGAKVFPTVNTLLYDEEIEEAENLINNLAEIGADAIIVQDMAALEMDIPNIPLHLSTQGHNYDLEKIKFMSGQGFQRIVLARELSVDQIKNIASNVDCELEAFIHGSLCVSLSGQCYMSAHIGGRSGNRGECAQPCRKTYNLEDAEGNVLIRNKHLLCIKDMNRSKGIADLVNAGVTSLKIEGRLKDINYVKNLTAHYRQILDKIIEGNDNIERASLGKVTFDFNPDADRTFNRQYSEYFLNGRTEKIGSFATPKSFGKYLGKVTRVEKYHFELDTREALSNGDGLVFMDKSGKLTGLRVNKVKSFKFIPLAMNGLYEGADVYRNMDMHFEKLLDNSKTARNIEVDIHFSDTPDGFMLKMTAENGISITESFVTDKELAKSGEIDTKSINKQLKKLGSTPFSARNVNINISKPYFMPVKVLNEMRRMAAEKLEAEIAKAHIVPQIKRPKNTDAYPQQTVTYLENITNRLAEKFYEKHGADIEEMGVEFTEKTEDKKLMTTKMCIKYELDACPVHQNPKEPLPDELYISSSARDKFRLEFDCKNCQMNIFAV